MASQKPNTDPTQSSPVHVSATISLNSILILSSYLCLDVPNEATFKIIRYFQGLDNSQFGNSELL
jgi:hypothetical protein